MLHVRWDLYIAEFERAARDSIQRIHEGTAMTSQMLEQSRAVLQESHKLLQDIPLVPRDQLRFAGRRTQEPFPMQQEEGRLRLAPWRNRVASWHGGSQRRLRGRAERT